MYSNYCQSFTFWLMCSKAKYRARNTLWLGQIDIFLHTICDLKRRKIWYVSLLFLCKILFQSLVPGSKLNFIIKKKVLWKYMSVYPFTELSLFPSRVMREKDLFQFWFGSLGWGKNVLSLEGNKRKSPQWSVKEVKTDISKNDLLKNSQISSKQMTFCVIFFIFFEGNSFLKSDFWVKAPQTRTAHLL